LLLAVVALAACTSSRSIPGDRPRPIVNAVVILADTLRADHLSLYGYSRATSPTLDRLAHSAVVFEQARSQSACTFPSVDSLLASRPPVDFLRSAFASNPDARSARGDWLPTILKRAGFSTFAASASPVVRKSAGILNRIGGYGEGFDRFDEACETREAACVNAAAEHFLAGVREPFFAYLHYFDPHGPYQPPATHPRRIAVRVPGTPWVRLGDPKPIERRVTRNLPPLATAEDVQGLVDLYDEEIAYWDTQLGLLFEILAARGLRERTLVVLVADHGEMFLEHGDIKHCRRVFDTVVRTPLVAWIPGVAGRRISEPVENLDVAPTVLDYLGHDPAPYPFIGRSLRTLVEGRPATTRYAHAQMGTLFAVTDGRHKLILDAPTNKVWLYDLMRDPGEQVDRSRELPDVSARLRPDLDEWIAAASPSSPRITADRARDFDRRLRALGYVQ
jgi:arylsulfatase